METLVSECPMCRAQFGGHFVVEKGCDRDGPLAGNFTICAACGSWLRFCNEEGALRLVVKDDMKDLSERDRQILKKLTELILLVRG